MKFVKAVLAGVALMFLMGQGCATPVGFGMGPGFGGAPVAGGIGGCPVGTVPTMDKYGNNVCRNMQTGTDVSVSSGLGGGGCPTGSFPTMDKFGNKVCRNTATGQTFYDTSNGCPIGTHPGMDKFGNNVCRR